MSSADNSPTNEIKIQDTIDNLNHPLASYIRGFLSREKKLSQQEIIIDDVENIEEAIKNGIKLNKLFISGQDHLPAPFISYLPSSLPIYEIAPRTCKKIFEKEKMSRIFAVAPIPNTSLSSFKLTNSKRDIVILDGISISGNIGAIIRTATAFDVSGIIVLNAHPMDIYDRRVIRASRGYIFRTPIFSAKIEELLQFCHANQFKLLMLSTSAEKNINEVITQKDKFAIALGAEKIGCSKELSKKATIHAKIPTNPSVESLNVSVATSIILYMRRHHSKISQ